MKRFIKWLKGFPWIGSHYIEPKVDLSNDYDWVAGQRFQEDMEPKFMSEAEERAHVEAQLAERTRAINLIGEDNS